MIVIVQATVLTVGLNSKNEVLRELPVELITMQSGSEAARYLKNEKIDSIISKWDLVDGQQGEFLKRLKAVKPHIPTIVFVKTGDREQEIAARCLGASAVLSEDTDDELFQKVVSTLLGLREIVSIKAISPAVKHHGSHTKEKIKK